MPRGALLQFAMLRRGVRLHKEANCSDAVRPIDDVKLLKAKTVDSLRSLDGKQCIATADTGPPELNASASNTIDVCFLAFGGPARLAMAMLSIRNIEAQSSSLVRYHLLVDRPTSAYDQAVCADAEWKSLVSSSRAWFYSLRSLSKQTNKLHRALAATATGNGRLYLYKNILHQVHSLLHTSPAAPVPPLRNSPGLTPNSRLAGPSHVAPPCRLSRR